MAAAELGMKQVCPTCQSKFYDLNRRPAHCPKCGADFDPEEAIRSRRNVRGRAGVPDDTEEKEDQVVADTDENEDEEEETTPEIDQGADDTVLVDDEEGDAAPGGSEDLGVDISEGTDLEEEADGVPFLEDEDDDIPDDDLGLPEDGDEADR